MFNVARLLESALKHHRAGCLQDAEHFYRKLLRRSPGHAGGLHGLGLIAHQRGDQQRAAKLIGKAIGLCPGIPLLYSNLAMVQQTSGDFPRAEKTLLKAITRFSGTRQFDSQMAVIHAQLGELYLANGHQGWAFEHVLRSVQLKPDHAPGYTTLGSIEIRRGRLDSAIRFLRQAIRIRPDLAEAHDILGRLFHDSGRLEEARACYLASIRAQPGYSQPYCNLGNLFLESGMVEPAVHCLRKALDLKPDYAEAYVNLAVARLDLDDFAGALDHFRYACQLKPDDANLHGYWSHALLLRGYFDAGWAANEWGLTLGARIVTEVQAPFWDGSSLAGRTVLVLSEQGVGDQVMFASCIPDLLKKAMPDTCILQCDARLIPLYRRSFPKLRFLATQQDSRWSGGPPYADAKVAIGSLPRLYRTRHDDFAVGPGYLVADPARVACWKTRYKALPAKRVVGISWRGGHREQQRRQRSTRLAQWRPVLSTPGTVFVNLQYGDCRRELATVNSGKHPLVYDFPEADPLTDLDDFAAQIAALDLVISTDNCTVHIAGALGVNVWTLLPYVPDWRWSRKREDTPWYPGMKLFRQTAPGDWQSLLQRVADSLRTRCDGG